MKCIKKLVFYLIANLNINEIKKYDQVFIVSKIDDGVCF